MKGSVYVAKRVQEKQSVHDQAVLDIGNVRFGNWEGVTVHTNPGSEHNYGAKKGDGYIYPDIVIEKTGTDTITVVVEVETASSVTEEEATSQWKEYASLGCPFYLYVESGSGAKAKRLAKDLNISINRFREWHYESGQLKVTEL